MNSVSLPPLLADGVGFVKISLPKPLIPPAFIYCTAFWNILFSSRQGVLAAVFSTMFGSKDPEQVNTMAKQAGEVSVGACI